MYAWEGGCGHGTPRDTGFVSQDALLNRVAVSQLWLLKLKLGKTENSVPQLQ